MPRVVVSGLGVVSPVGTGARAFWDAIAAGATGIAPWQPAEGSRPRRVAARVAAFNAAEFIRDTRLRRVCNRAFAMLASAAILAWEDGEGERLAAGGARVGVSVGLGSIDQYTDDLRETIGETRAGAGGEVELASFFAAARRLHPLRRLQYLPNIAAAVVSILHRATGPTVTFVSGVAAGMQAIVAGAAMIHDGRADAVLCGGVDARFTPHLLAAISEQLELSDAHDAETACRPFDAGRSGAVLGEGAAALLLESGALAAGRRRYAALAGCSTFDKARCAESLRALFDRSGIGEPAAVVAHGDGGVISDLIEARALSELFGSPARAPAVTSIQPAIGHTVCASGPFAAATACLAIAEGTIPPIRSLSEPIAPLPFVTGAARVQRVDSALANCIEPGGAGSAILFCRP